MFTPTLLSHAVLPPEWHPQDAIILAWPHCDTDWCYMLNEVQSCFIQVARAILRDNRLIVIAPDTSLVKQQLSDIDNGTNIIYQELATNDTWARDFGPLAMTQGNNRMLLDFKFNAWGMKFAACHDNLICQRLFDNEIFDATPVNCQDFVLEGGSIESDGQGVILTTSRCLLSPNRNGALSKEDIDGILSQRLGAKKVLWLNYGELVGDDTDAHIDTLARFAPNNTILYVKCDDTSDEQHESLQLMEKELMAMTNTNGEHFKLVPLPCPSPILDEDGLRLPATYANFLITNTQVLVPTYGQPECDNAALNIINKVFTTRRVVGIDCKALIKQHGSLHCITMQIPKNFLKK